MFEESTGLSELGEESVSNDKPPNLILGPEDPRYFDLKYHAAPLGGENGIAARLRQVAIVGQRNASLRGSITYQIKARKSAANAEAAAIEATKLLLTGNGENSDDILRLFPRLIPTKPYCADDLSNGLVVRSKKHALKKPHIQVNGPSSVRWLVHDLDYAEARFAHRDACLPPPNIIAINNANGHAHAFILLEVPVAKHSEARPKPLQFLAAIERGIRRRLNADPAYSGLICKNPLNCRWEVECRRARPYTLLELDDSLFEHDKSWDFSPAIAYGHSRNCACFDAVRKIAYREVLDAKRTGISCQQFEAWLASVAWQINLNFSQPLPPSDIRAIAKSVAKWTWKKFSEEGLSARQSRLGKQGMAKRWQGHTPNRVAKPWTTHGISERTWYRRRKQQKATMCDALDSTAN